jgi:hypothetical protein|uniref:Uncharacterized protein n=1 Tax=viral metagenome TaxID=1070528 RepID=A0A6C0LTY2_9ZZZZ
MSLLIDIKKISNMNQIMNAIDPIPICDENMGVIIITDKLNKLKSIETNRIMFLNTTEFISSITGYSFVCFNSKRCILKEGCLDNLEIVIQNTLRYLPNNIMLICKGLSNSSKDKLKLCGFIPISDVSFGRLNDINIPPPLSGHIQNSTCSMNIFRMSDTTYNYMKDLSNRGSILSNGSIRQHEIAGVMEPGICNNNVKELNLCDKLSGANGSVSMKPSPFSFHTHPVEAYEQRSVKYGWPSATDYITFYKATVLYPLLILHIVVSVEGFYVLSKPHHHVTEISEKIEKAIRENKVIDKTKSYTPEEHVAGISSMRVDGLRIVNVKFFTWRDDKSPLFEI